VEEDLLDRELDLGACSRTVSDGKTDILIADRSIESVWMQDYLNRVTFLVVTMTTHTYTRTRTDVRARASLQSFCQTG